MPLTRLPVGSGPALLICSKLAGSQIRPVRMANVAGQALLRSLLSAHGEPHTLAAVVWVGGMFFAHNVLRPTTGPFEPAERLALWRRVFRRFSPWVWASIVFLLASGYGLILIYFGGFSGAGMHIHIMKSIGIVMMLLFCISSSYLGAASVVPWSRKRSISPSAF